MNMPLWKDIEAKAAKLGVTVGARTAAMVVEVWGSTC